MAVGNLSIGFAGNTNALTVSEDVCVMCDFSLSISLVFMCGLQRPHHR